MSSSVHSTRKLAAILFADIVGYTKWVHEDETHALERRRNVEQLVKTAAGEQNGRVVKFMGDGAMLEFPSAVSAVSAALQIQREITNLNTGRPDERQLQLRIGIHVGDVVEEGFDLYGTGVNIASRVQTMAPPGGICITREVYAQIKPILKLECEKVMSLPEKDLPEPIDVYAVGGTVAKPTSKKSETLRWAALCVVSVAVWATFFLAWNKGMNTHALITYGLLACLVVAARKLAPEAIGQPVKPMEKMLLLTFGVMVWSVVFVGLVGLYGNILDILWESHTRYKTPSERYSDVKAMAEQFPRLLPSIASSGPYDVRAPSVNRGMLIKNLSAAFNARTFSGMCILATFVFFYLFMVVAMMFSGKRDKAGKKKFHQAMATVLIPFVVAAFMTSFPPVGLNQIANPVPLREYHVTLPSRITSHIVHQWAKDLDLGIDENAAYPIHSVATGKKLGDLQIVEIREVDAYARWRRTSEGITMMRPPFQVRLMGNSTESHLQLDFGNQPGGKIPTGYAEAIPALEKRLKEHGKIAGE